MRLPPAPADPPRQNPSPGHLGRAVPCPPSAAIIRTLTIQTLGTRRRLNRALLDRQLLLDRAPSLSIPEAVEQVGGLQTQYAPSGYVGLWTRLASFARDDLTRALEDHSVIQATLMRTTIHLVSRREYWRFAMGIRRSQREWAASARCRRSASCARMPTGCATPCATVRRPSRTSGDWAKGFIGHAGPVGGSRAGAAIGHLGAPPGPQARPRRGLGRPDRRHGRRGS